MQTLSRLNRKYPGKTTRILDFYNEPEEVLAAFQEYYQTAELLDVSDPNLIWDLFETPQVALGERWKGAVPLVPLAAAAGAFSDEQTLDFAVLEQSPDWVRPLVEVL